MTVPVAEHVIQPLVRHTLHDELVSRIRDMIVEGQLEPGARINEGALGRALGVSRTPLREALKFVASEGLIDLVPGRGGIVRRLTPQDVRNMLDVLTALETLAGRLACRSATGDQISAVRALHDRMMTFYAERQRLKYYKLNQAIHTAIAVMSGNDFLAATHASIQARLKRIRFVGNEAPDNWSGAVREHVEIIEALERRDETALTEVLTRHLAETWTRVRPIL